MDPSHVEQPSVDAPDAPDAPNTLDTSQVSQRATDGCAIACVALLFAAPALWMFWMVRKFANGDGWFDFVVRLVLDELILAIGLFAAVLLIWGVFAPPWLEPVVDWAARHTAQIVLTVFAILFGSLILFIFVYAVLFTFGVEF